MFEFEFPWVFVLLPLALAAYYFLPKAKNTQTALRVPFFARMSAISGASHASSTGSLLRTILLSLSWLLFLSAAARPQWIGDPVPLPSAGRDLMVAVDFSESMLDKDMLTEGEYFARIDIVKALLGEFLERRKGDRVGLIAFASNAYLYAPLSFDLATTSTLLKEAQVGIAGRQTAIGDAIGLAVKNLKDRPESQRTLVLLTDGENTAGILTPLDAANLAKEAKVKIYTIGLGAESMTISVDPFGMFTEEINPSKNLDESTLTEIAQLTGGLYFRARDTDELENIYRSIDKIEPIDLEEVSFRPRQSLFFWPLSLSLLLLIIILIGNRNNPKRAAYV